MFDWDDATKFISLIDHRLKKLFGGRCWIEIHDEKGFLYFSLYDKNEVILTEVYFHIWDVARFTGCLFSLRFAEMTSEEIQIKLVGSLKKLEEND